MLLSEIKIINKLLRVFKTKNLPILILGHGRSGTTWIGNTLAQAPKTLLYHEPCRKWFTYLEPDDENEYFENQIENAFKGLIMNNVSVWYNGKKSLQNRLWPNYRVIVKEIASITNIAWLRHKFEFQSLFVIRHPCSVTLSEYERNVDFKNSLIELLKNSKLVALLTKEELQVVHDAKEPFEQYAVIWALRHKPFSIIQQGKNPIDVAMYETIATSPLTEFKALFKKFDLLWTKDIEDYIYNSTSIEKKGFYATSKIASNHINRWKDKMSAKEIEQVKNFTLPFKIGFYDNENDFI